MTTIVCIVYFDDVLFKSNDSKYIYQKTAEYITYKGTN